MQKKYSPFLKASRRIKKKRIRSFLKNTILVEILRIISHKDRTDFIIFSRSLNRFSLSEKSSTALPVSKINTSTYCFISYKHYICDITKKETFILYRPTRYKKQFEKMKTRKIKHKRNTIADKICFKIPEHDFIFK